MSALLPYVESDDLRFVVTYKMGDPHELAPDAPILESEGVSNGERISQITGALLVFTGPSDIPEDRRDSLQEIYTNAIENEDFHSEAEESELPIEYANSEEAKDAAIAMYEEWSDREDLLRTLVE